MRPKAGTLPVFRHTLKILAPRPLYIGQWMLIDECLKLLVFRLFSGTLTF